jgi:hypothetical protein
VRAALVGIEISGQAHSHGQEKGSRGRRSLVRCSRFLRVLAVSAAACWFAAWPGPAGAYIDAAPLTLGALCADSHDICVLQVEKFSVERGVIIFKCVEILKGKPDATSKHAIASSRFFTRPRYDQFNPEIRQKKVKEMDDFAKIILDWAAVGKTAVLFDIRSPLAGTPVFSGHVYIDNFWYRMIYEEGFGHLFEENSETLLTRYCGPPARLKDVVSDILKNKEVVVPCMLNDNKEDLQQRKAKIQRMRASLKLRDYNPKRDFVGWGAEEN